ncbi:MAG: ABC transporter ATP-binding protein [Acidimicrobiaceae bacterium]|nr:ABC transporter ATP-binding protein [Acidimicrobiaceae bacterium]MXZ96412.1 ABC transporter ATP-binding protein [Acidimicrobiaceae bacterium]MYF41769.1 ABC transporter ATP-binding protein [Acidimicrobiaceae bacterium]MYJ36664.1 ABC transporter ATP-binding protein [Acidimicrobiaceae bacterium]
MAAPEASAVRRGRGILVDEVSVALGGSPVLRSASISAEPGRTLAILGPSGCGKTTLLRVLAGLQRLDSGQVVLGGTLMSGPGVHVAADKRGIGMVFQDWSLFPHLTVAANVAFGLPRSERPRSRVLPRPASGRVRDLLDMVGIAELADRLPGSLSGGQQQRVALARALAPQPSVLLLDEPFSSLDTTLRVEVRAEVAALLRELEVTCLFVTHDQDEAFVLGDEVAVMRDGAVIQQAAPAMLYEQPADRWLAGFVGEADTVVGRAEGDIAYTSMGPMKLQSPIHGEVDVLLRPEELALTEGSSGTVDHIEFFGHDTLYYIRSADGKVLRCRTTGAPRFGIGADVDLCHSGERTVAFPRSV